ncbi:fimbrial protein [Paraburkholderia acidipaludis]|uniref:fimbrial protein n=1 Tax=Paraburkholderia acidipaludis TaxID=660537 RepID=UPI001C3F2F43|nr:fimbrial protein [Paraburkholderia acidipaludis]
MNFFNVHKSRCCSFLLAIATFAMVLGAKGAWAAAGSCSGSGASYTVTMPASVTVPRDTTAPTQLTAWVQSAQNTAIYNCSGGSAWYGMAVAPNGLVDSGVTWSNGGQMYHLYQTSVNGVGLALAFNEYNENTGNWTGYLAVNPSGATGAGWSGPPPAGWTGGGSSGGSTNHGGLIQAALVSYGPVSAGSTSGGQVLKGAAYGSDVGILSLPYSSYSITATAINVVACTTPDVTVPLGTHKTTELTGVNTTTAAVGFNIALNNCPAGINKVYYEIDNATSIANASQSVVALDGTSTATGMGVQILNSSGSPQTLGSKVQYTGYNTSGGSFSIPLQARYYQTASAVTPGTANTSLTFIMTYQ